RAPARRTRPAAAPPCAATTRHPALGWYIVPTRNEIYTDRVFAGLAMVILLGLVVEGAGFRVLERLTVRRWGMQR
ncbi:MAG: ABC transporter permease, partial [Xanthomonas sp.]